jgi:DNA invertase Pin-like site-specific DNA recombinase
MTKKTNDVKVENVVVENNSQPVVPVVVEPVKLEKEFTSANCHVQFSLGNLEVQNLNEKDSQIVKVTSKSELFRKLYDFGMEVCEIARECGSHYSFVYGVISSSREVRTVEKSSKSDEIRKLVDDGKTPGEIAKLLNSNYSFVFSVVKKYKETKKEA